MLILYQNEGIKFLSVKTIRSAIKSLQKLSESRIVVADIAGVSVLQITANKVTTVATVTLDQGVLYSSAISAELICALCYDNQLSLIRLEETSLRVIDSAARLDGMCRTFCWPYVVTITGQIGTISLSAPQQQHQS